MSVHDETWDKCSHCGKTQKTWEGDFHQHKHCLNFNSWHEFNEKFSAEKILPYITDPKLIADINSQLIPNNPAVWRSDQPKPFDNGGWNEDPSNLMFPKLKEPQKQNFLILWTAFGQYEFVQDYLADPHEYAWSHDKYKISPYIIIPIDQLPKKFKQTPEDDLLDKAFGKQ